MNEQLKKLIIILLFMGPASVYGMENKQTPKTLKTGATIELPETRLQTGRRGSVSDVLNLVDAGKSNPNKLPIIFRNKKDGLFSLKIGNDTISLKKDIIEQLTSIKESTGSKQNKEILNNVATNLRTMFWAMQQINAQNIYIDASFTKLLEAAQSYDAKQEAARAKKQTRLKGGHQKFTAKFKPVSLHEKGLERVNQNNAVLNPDAIQAPKQYTHPPVASHHEHKPPSFEQPQQSAQRQWPYIKIATIAAAIIASPFVFIFAKNKIVNRSVKHDINSPNIESNRA